MIRQTCTSWGEQAISQADSTPSPWTEVEGIDALRVPGHTQPDREPECLLYAMWMCLNYVSTAYPARVVRSETTVLSPEEMKDHITIRESGWAPDQDTLDGISKETDPVSWELKKWNGAPPMNTLYEIVKDGLEDELPTIAVVDAMRLKGYNRDGPLHAVVVTGLGDRKVVLNNPWGSMYEVYNRDRVADAWDTLLNRLITIDLREQTTLNDTLTEDSE